MGFSAVKMFQSDRRSNSEVSKAKVNDTIAAKFKLDLHIKHLLCVIHSAL